MPCCARPFEISRDDDACRVIPHILACPFGCSNTMCTGCGVICDTRRQQENHLGPSCFDPLRHTVDDVARLWTDEQLTRLFVDKLDRGMPHCPRCRRFGIKFGGDCNAIDCVCGAQWCFVCNKRMARSGVEYLDLMQTDPKGTAFMVQWLDSSSASAPAFEMISALSGPLSSRNHHGGFQSIGAMEYRFNPDNPGQAGTLCPSTLQHFATAFGVPEFVRICQEYYAARKRHSERDSPVTLEARLQAPVLALSCVAHPPRPAKTSPATRLCLRFQKAHSVHGLVGRRGARWPAVSKRDRRRRRRRKKTLSSIGSDSPRHLVFCRHLVASRSIIVVFCC